jgi:hypothetical protein
LRDGPPTNNAGADFRLDRVLRLVLFERPLEAINLCDLQRAHMISHLNTKRRKALHQVTIVEPKLPRDLVHPDLAHSASDNANAR